MLQLIDNRVAVESYLLQLLGHFLNVMGMGMAYRDDGMTTIEVQVFLALIIPHPTALALDDVDVEERIYIE